VTGRTPPAFRTSLIVATYNWKEALAAVLSTVSAQRMLPDEVIVADDGSRSDTGELVARTAASFPVPLLHVWHEDAGFRLGTIRNKAMAAASGDYLIQLDGDLLLHPMFVAAHARFAERGTYVQGSRAMLGEVATARHLDAQDFRIGLLTRGVRNRANALYAPMLARFVRGPTDPLTRTRGANMAFWREDILRVNGYDERIEGWGREDSELAARLLNAGLRRRNLKFAAVAWHLHHTTRPQDTVSRNHAIFERTMRERTVRCECGIDRHLGTLSA
jgi:glycosyltransferase involved in cell wall biosynthesis